MLHKIAQNFSLAHEQDSPLAIHDSIVSGIIVRGTNLWILMLAIVIASVGLNINSTAVIIGIGYGLGTYDFDLVRQAIKNFLFAVIASLIVSTLYFSVSPINEAHSELLARTSPNIYDVLIAFFGGLAGFIAIVSRQKGNVITGVAIATALIAGTSSLAYAHGCHCHSTHASPMYRRLWHCNKSVVFFARCAVFIYHQHGIYCTGRVNRYTPFWATAYFTNRPHQKTNGQ